MKAASKRVKKAAKKQVAAPKENPRWEQFKKAAREIIENPQWRVLCHGFVVTSKVVKGREFFFNREFAWVESGKLAYDPSTRAGALPVKEFYRLMRVDASMTIKYTRRQMWAKFRKHGSYRYNWEEL